MKGKKIMLSKEENYGNWVPANMIKFMWAGDIVLAVLTIVFAAVLKVAVPAWITGEKSGAMQRSSVKRMQRWKRFLTE